MNHVIPRELTRKREVEATELRIAGLTQAQIGEKLGISQQGVARLLKRVDDRARARSEKNLEAMRDQQDETLSEILSESLLAWERSRDSPTPKEPFGSQKFLLAALQASSALSRLHGLDAAKKLEIQGQPERPEVDLAAQREIFADPELRRLALERARREHQLRQASENTGRLNSRGIWASTGSSGGEN